MAGACRPTRKGKAMVGRIRIPLVGRLLLASALGCGATGILLLPMHRALGLVLCVVAVVDLCLVWLLRWWSPAGQPAPSPR
jgi:hypothetical protein